MKSKFNITEAKLKDLYLDKGLTRKETAKYFGCCDAYLKVFIRKWKLFKKVYVLPLKLDRDWLYRKAVIENMTGKEIADILGCRNTAINDHLRKHNIPVKKAGGQYLGLDVDEIRRLYEVEELTTSEICEKLKISAGALSVFMNKHGIKARYYSRQEGRLYKLVTEVFPRAIYNKRMKVCGKVRCPDILIKKHKIIIEYDGLAWHQLPEDKQRDFEFISEGYKIIHYQEYIPTLDELKTDLERIINSKSKLSGYVYKQKGKDITFLIDMSSSYRALAKTLKTTHRSFFDYVPDRKESA